MEDTKGTTTVDTPPPAAGTEAGAPRFSRAKEAIGEKYTQASQAVKNKYAAVRTKVEEVDFAGATEKVRTYVRENPGKALLISVAVGFAIGMLIRRSRRDDD